MTGIHVIIRLHCIIIDNFCNKNINYYTCMYSRILISQTSKGNKNWLKKQRFN